MKKIILTLMVLLFFTACSSSDSNDGQGPTGLATCLTDNGATMYGTEWCGHCQNQKAMFGDSFKDVNFVDCDQDRSACQAAGIRGYPTWVIGGKQYPGTQSLATLAELVGCKI